MPVRLFNRKPKEQMDYFPESEAYEGPTMPTMFKQKRTVIIGVILVLLLSFFWTGVYNVERGNLGVIFDKTKHGVRAEPLEQGWHWHIPFVQLITEYPVAQRAYTLSRNIGEGTKAAVDDSVLFTSKDNQSGNMNVTLAYGINPTMAAVVYDTFSGKQIDDIEDEYIRLKCKAAVQVATAQYAILEIHGGQKANVAQTSETVLRELFQEDSLKLKEQYENRIASGQRTVIDPEKIQPLFVVYSLTFGEDYLPETVQSYINQILNAETDRRKAEIGLEEARINAQRQIAEAEAQLVASRAQSDAKIILAQGEAQANKLISASLTPELVRLQIARLLADNVEIIDVDTLGLKNIFGMDK